MYAILADDQELIRVALSAVIKQIFGFTVIQTSNAAEAVELTSAVNPVLVILDLMMPGMDSFQAAKQIRLISPHSKILLLTGRNDIDLVIQSREANIHGYVLKGDSAGEVTHAIKTVLAGGLYLPPSMAHMLLDPARQNRTLINRLTSREKSVVALIAQGLAMKQIARAMAISVKTAETHRSNLGRKLNYPSKAQLFAFAMQHKMIDTEALAITA